MKQSICAGTFACVFNWRQTALMSTCYPFAIDIQTNRGEDITMLSRIALGVVVPFYIRADGLLIAVIERSASWPLWRRTGHGTDKTNGTPVSTTEAFSPVTDVPRRSCLQVFHNSRAQFHG